MPQAANLVVKNAAGVDKTFALNTPAPGYGQPAEWALKEGANASVFPTWTASADRTTKAGAATRHVRVKFRSPAYYTDPTTGLPVKTVAFEFNGTIAVPEAFPETAKDDSVAFATNLFASALNKAMIRDGLPAT